MQQPSVWPSPGHTKMKSDSLGTLCRARISLALLLRGNDRDHLEGADQ
jgi:hypothetical protein